MVGLKGLRNKYRYKQIFGHFMCECLESKQGKNYKSRVREKDGEAEKSLTKRTEKKHERERREVGCIPTN